MENTSQLRAVSRRRFAATLATAVCLAPVILGGAGCSDKTPPPSQPGGIYTFKLGDATLSVLPDRQQRITNKLLIGATPAILEKYAPDGSVPNAINAFLIQSGGKNTLVDTGLGTKVFDNLKTLGLAPEDITNVFITHMHGDHIGGLLRDGKAAFPNATLHIAHPEIVYWLAKEGSPAKEISAAYKGQTVLFNPVAPEAAGRSLPGVTAIAAFGHTPGHTVFRIESAGKRLLIWGDLTHATAVQLPHPEVAVTYDVDPARAVVSRKQIFEYAAKNKIAIAGMHIAWPGTGTIAAAPQGGFAFTPAT
ncbi:MAG: MBL fold metallo-hydrolase [Puniceicoccales bacterium]|jgi:glyoxylase-like metal-dependent hydrolase (beta-lactamase superfamily II)|nr:MBL fold metallo-hydrolase [Puniceicoccales bacterium]